MALETVRILVEDDALVPAPVDDVVVRVYDVTGTTLITSGTTGAVEAGIAEFTLNGEASPVTYQLRFFISGGSLVSPRGIAVYSPASSAPSATNNFSVTASLFTLPMAADPRLCRCSGIVKGPDGRPRRGIDMHFVPRFNPLIVDGYAVLGERVAVRTDATGYVSIDLYRNGIYDVTVESQENTQREACVPDRSSLALADLLFPIVASVAYSVPLTVAAGASIAAITTVIATNFMTLEGSAADDVTYSVDDQAIASIEVLSDRILIYGNAAGTTTLRATRKDSSVVRIPDTGISGGAATITVS